MTTQPIYLRVGWFSKNRETGEERVVLDDRDPQWNRNEPISDAVMNRKTVIAVEHFGRTIEDKIILAVYQEDELHSSDLKLIKRHRSFNAMLDGVEIHFYGFTHDHFFETLRECKVKMLEKNNIGDDDGTVFGKVCKMVTVPEQVIPEHQVEKFVQWDDWNDGYIDSYYDD